MAQGSSFRYPTPRKADTTDSYFGTKVADPYRWMEDLNSPELKEWIDAENVITFACPRCAAGARRAAEAHHGAYKAIRN